jgi:hypothetical protein
MSISVFLEEFEGVKFDPSQTHRLFKNALTPLPEMQAFKEYIEFSRTEGNFRSDSEGMYILHTDPSKHDLSQFLEVQDLRLRVREIYDQEIDSVGITLLISENSKYTTTNPTGIKRHYDQQDTMHWCCVGSSKWYIYKDNTEEIEFEYTVETGDIMFVKKSIFHEVESLSPRAACILTMHKNGVEHEDNY